MLLPDFERDRFEGQMNPEERAVLFGVIMEEKPEHVWEVGTCRGGGSTYYISTALLNNGKGILHTCEVFDEFYQYARRLYGEGGALHHLEPLIDFNFGDASEVYRSRLGILPCDVVLIDGGERSMELIWQFAMFRPHMRVGSVVIFHDWNNGKTDYIRPVIQNDQDWRLEDLTIGLATWRRIGAVHK
jgi:predicted O-methyltransferase YrrM